MKKERKIQLRKVRIQTLTGSEQKAVNGGIETIVGSYEPGTTSIPVFCKPLVVING